MTRTIDLGETSLSTSDLTLEITLHTSIQIDFTESWSGGDVETLEEAVHSGNVWLDQTPELRLYIYVKDTQSLVCPLSNVTSSVADICTSKIWHDLGLTVYLKSCEYNEQEDGVQISLGARKSPVPFALAKRSKIPTWLRNPQEAHPPSAVPVASVSAINVFLGINTYNALYTSTSPAWIPNVPYWNEPCASNSTPVIDEDEELNILDDVYQIEEEGSQPDSYIRDELTLSAKHDHTSQEFVSLFKDGLKGIITGPSQQENHYTNIPEFEPTHSLSQIVPTVFNPGYREAMNQRAQLIPSIAKSITSLLKTTRNRNKASDLQKLHPKQPKTNQEDLHPQLNTDTTDLRDAIKTSLWRIAQTQLYNPQAALKLHFSQEITADPSLKRSLLSEDSLLEAPEEDILGEYHHREDTIDSYIGTDEEAAREEEEGGDSCSLLSFERESTVSPSSTCAQQDILNLGLCPDQETPLCSLLENVPRGNELALLDRIEYEIHQSMSPPWLGEEKNCMGDEFDYMLCD